MSHFSAIVLSADTVLFEGQVTAVSIPSVQGYLTVLKGHMPIVGMMQKGAITVHAQPVGVNEKSPSSTETTTHHTNEEKPTVHTFEVAAGFFEMGASGCTLFVNSNTNKKTL